MQNVKIGFAIIFGCLQLRRTSLFSARRTTLLKDLPYHFFAVPSFNIWAKIKSGELRIHCLHRWKMFFSLSPFFNTWERNNFLYTFFPFFSSVMIHVLWVQFTRIYFCDLKKVISSHMSILSSSEERIYDMCELKESLFFNFSFFSISYIVDMPNWEKKLAPESNEVPSHRPTSSAHARMQWVPPLRSHHQREEVRSAAVSYRLHACMHRERERARGSCTRSNGLRRRRKQSNSA